MNMWCWIKYSDSHGPIGFEPVWLPAGQIPEKGDVQDAEKYRRAPKLDCEIFNSKPQEQR